jgi:glucokinase
MGLYTIGVDIGGTNIKLGLVNSRGKIVGRHTFGTKNHTKRPQDLIQVLIEAIEFLMAKYKILRKDLAGIAFGLPGLVDPQSGVVQFLPNIPNWKNIPLKKIVEQRLKIPTFLENDVNMITLGEWKFGAGKGFANMICMTLGTGVGGGLIFNNALYRGEGFAAGEIGHMPINEEGPACSCGGVGCLEQYVGNKTTVPLVRKLFGDNSLSFPDVYPLAVAGNTKALKFWEEVGRHLGNGLVGVVNLLNPRLIVIGGGMSNNLRFMKKTIEKTIHQHSMPVQAKMVKIVRAQLGDDAGIIGAHVLVKESQIA